MAARHRVPGGVPGGVPVGVPVGEPVRHPEARRAASAASEPSEPTPEQMLQLIHLVLSMLRYVRDWPLLKLLACVFVDALGFSTFLLPGLGEGFDLAWAPIQAWFLYFMFGGLQITAIGFFEEIFPGTDFVPSATLAWVSENIDAPTIQAVRAFTGVPLRTRR